MGVPATEDYLHAPSGRADWRESYYFNFADATGGLSGFSTVGLVPGAPKREFVFALFEGGRREVYFAEPEGQYPSDLSALSDNHLTYELLDPLRGWRIRFAKGEVRADLLWRARFPAFYFGEGSGTSWDGHFEQSGTVEGVVELAGRRLEVRGLGQRDKSWGSRDWHIEGWYALHAQFGSLSIGLRRDTARGTVHSSGGVSSEGGHTAITEVDAEAEFAEVGGRRVPIRTETRISCDGGRRYTVRSALLSPTSFVRFERPFPGGTTELFEAMVFQECVELGERGTGLMEWLFTHRGGDGAISSRGLER